MWRSTGKAGAGWDIFDTRNGSEKPQKILFSPMHDRSGVKTRFRLRAEIVIVLLGIGHFLFSDSLLCHNAKPLLKLWCRSVGDEAFVNDTNSPSS